MTRTPEALRRPASTRFPAAAALLRPSVGELDAALFTPADWFCLDARNRRVPRVRPGTLTAALALIGQGTITTVVGRVRPQIAAIDIDAGGPIGDAVRAALLTWCAERDVWALSRASGGGPGRWHVLCAPDTHRPDLLIRLDELRTQHQLSGTAVDLRQHLRPLSAPHRTGAVSPLPTGLPAALRALHATLQLPSSPAAPTAGPGQGRTAAPAGHVPLPRRRQPLPEVWQTYLRTGQAPASTTTWHDATSSSVEFVATFFLLINGHTQSDAWQVISDAHPRAFSKTRERGHSWWRRHLWDRVGVDADTWLSHHPRPTSAGPTRVAQVLAATAAARLALDAEWLTWGRDERHSLRAVLEALLERMERTGSLTVPCPERDLLLDTPVRSRTSIRRSLHRLGGLGFGQRRDTFTPGSAVAEEKSHTFTLDQRFQRTDRAAVPLVVPPLNYTPPPPPLRHPGLWRMLGLPARHIYQAVAQRGLNGVPAIAAAAGLVHGPDREPSLKQRRTTQNHLQTLASIGLLHVDAQGRWLPTTVSMLPPTWQRAIERNQHHLGVTVAAERASFRDWQRPLTRWHQQRASTLARMAKNDLARQRAWWDHLPALERTQRRAQRTALFTALPLTEQQGRRAALTLGRASTGVTEESRRLAWIAGQTPQDYAHRVGKRAAAYAALPRSQQLALVASWEHHRQRHGLSRRILPRIIGELAQVAAVGHSPNSASIQPALCPVLSAGILSRILSFSDSHLPTDVVPRVLALDLAAQRAELMSVLTQR